MIELNAIEARVLGVLIEKARTTPDQYPLRLNALRSGCNQKSNRQPVLTCDEQEVLRALETLRDKKLVIWMDTSGSRVMKFRHNARETLELDTPELAILAELLLRGPQTLGELRTRAQRMYPFESLEVARNVVEHMRGRDEPLIRKVPPAPGGRAERYAQLLSPDLHAIEAAEEGVAGVTGAAPPAETGRIEQLEAEIRRNRRVIEELAKALGESDILLAEDWHNPAGPTPPEPEEA